MIDGAPVRQELDWNAIRRVGRRYWRLCIAWLAGNPLERPRSDEAHDQEVTSAEALRILPSVPVSIRALKRDVEHWTFVCFLTPDACAYGTVADFVDWLRTDFRWCFHNEVFVKRLI